MGCPSNTPITQLSICTKTCDSTNQQLQSPLLTNCISYPSSSNVFSRTYPDLSNLIKYQIADGVWVSEEFKQSTNEKMKQITFSTFTNALTNWKVQLQGIIYLIGEWKEGSYVRLKLNSTKDTTTIKNVVLQQETIQYSTSFTNQFKYTYFIETTTTVTCTTIDCQQTVFMRTDFQYELVTINKTNNKFVANPSNLFDVYQTKLTLLNGTTIQVSKVILNTECLIPSNPQFLTFSIEQNVQGDNAMYAFQDNIYIYSASKLDQGCSSYSLQACIKCKSPYYAHLGKCVPQCPIHSRVLESVKNCTDYKNIETLQYTPGISQNSSGIYLIQDFYTQSKKVAQSVIRKSSIIKIVINNKFLKLIIQFQIIQTIIFDDAHNQASIIFQRIENTG